MFVPFLCLISLSCFPTARGELQAVCSSDMTVLKNQTASVGMTRVTGRLPNDRNLQRSCVLKMDKPDGCLHVKAKRHENTPGFLNIFVYEAEGSSTLLGHVDASQPKHTWSSQTICPSSSVKPRDRFMSVVGTGGVSFAVDLSQSPSEIMLGVPQTVSVKSTKAIVFPFNPLKDISDRQLDITVTSLSNIPAYLKVSQIRKDVDENIALVDYKKKSLRLSFAKKGRITLSKVSEPSLTDSTSSWFIGIALKNTTGSLKPSESKKVTLKLSQSFDYSYAGPICALFFVSLVLGIVVSSFALWVFEEPLEIPEPESTVIANESNRDQGIQSSSGQDNNNNSQRDNYKCIKFIGEMCKVVYNHWFTGAPKTYSYATGVVGFALMVSACQFVIANWYIMIQEGDRDDCYYNDLCYRVSDFHDIPLNLMISNLTYIVHALILTVCVLYMETKLYLSCEDLKSENLPSTPPDNKDILPDHVFVCPNVTLHLLEGAVPKHTLGNEEKKKLMARAQKMKYSYSIGYAFAWALLFEGLFSLLYHLCPSRYTFQFDSAFMFVIAGLSVLMLCNGRELSKCPVYETKQQSVEAHSTQKDAAPSHPVQAHSSRGQQAGEQHPIEENSIQKDAVEADSAQQEEKHPVEDLPVGALNFFLYFIVPLFMFNYLGTLYHSESGLATGLQVVLFLFLCVWWLAMCFWALYKLKLRKGVSLCGKCKGNTDEMCWNMCWCIFGCFIVPPVLFVPIFIFMDLSQVFLFTCIAESVLAVTAKSQLLRKHCCLIFKGWLSCKCVCDCSAPTGKEFLQGCFIFVTAGVLAAAFSVFQGLATTDKTASPEDSRDLNKECGIGGFFDWHDLWHFLSSLGLLMGAFVIMFMSAEAKNSGGATGNKEPQNAAGLKGKGNETLDSSNMAASS